MKRIESVNGTIRGRDEDGNPNPVDVYVGKQLKKARISCGYSQQQVARMMAMTSQQIQKYEKAQNRIGCSRLLQLAQILGVSVNYFFDGYPVGAENIKNTKTSNRLSWDKKMGVCLDNDPIKPEEIDLLSNYRKLKNSSVSKEISNLVRTLSCPKF